MSVLRKRGFNLFFHHLHQTKINCMDITESVFVSEKFTKNSPTNTVHIMRIDVVDVGAPPLSVVACAAARVD